MWPLGWGSAGLGAAHRLYRDRRDVIVTVCSISNGVGVVYEMRFEFAVFSVLH